MLHRARTFASAVVAVLSAGVLSAGVLAPAMAPTPAAAAGPSYLLVLGDGVASNHQPIYGEQRALGYAGMVLQRMRQTDPGVTMVNLACHGETTKSFLYGGVCTYPEGSQLKAAKAFLRSHPGQVRAISLNLGGEDVHRCINLTARTTDTLCVAGAVAGVGIRMPLAVSGLRLAAPSTRLIVNTVYDPYVISTLVDKEGGRKQADQSLLAFDLLNGGIRTVAALNGARVADVYGAFDPRNFTIVDSFIGPIPQNAKNVCAYTWACDTRWNQVTAMHEGNVLIAGKVAARL